MGQRVVDILLSGKVGDELLVKGWLRTRRDSKGISFLELNDGSSVKSLQVIVSHDLVGIYETLPMLQTGAAVSCSGRLVESPGKKQQFELNATNIDIIGICDPEIYPLQKKRHSLEFLRSIGHLRPRTNTLGAVFRVRNAASFAVHSFFQQRGFIYVNTPIITTSDCEGAGKMFRVTTLDPMNPPVREVAGKKEVDYSQDFFGQLAALTVSGQLEGEAFALALKNIYTFGPTFRAENSNTPRHLAEFWMIEPEMAFCSLDGDMALAEDFVRYVINYVLENCTADLEFFDQWIEKGIINSLKDVSRAEFAYMTYTEAIKALENANRKFDFPISWGMDIQTEHERYLTEEFVGRPVFVTNYPKEIKAFYMRLDEGEKTVAAMDLLVPRLGEIIGGAQREERLSELVKRLAECGLREEDYSWYIDLRRFGSVPHAGFGLGFERLVMYLTGVSNIRDVIPFPRTPGNASF